LLHWFRGIGLNLKPDIAIGEPELVLKALNWSGKEGVHAVIAKRGEMERGLMPWLNLASWFSGHFLPIKRFCLL